MIKDLAYMFTKFVPECDCWPPVPPANINILQSYVQHLWPTFFHTAVLIHIIVLAQHGAVKYCLYMKHINKLFFCMRGGVSIGRELKGACTRYSMCALGTGMCSLSIFLACKT
jgi:hypothetical protein